MKPERWKQSDLYRWEDEGQLNLNVWKYSEKHASAVALRKHKQSDNMKEKNVSPKYLLKDTSSNGF